MTDKNEAKTQQAIERYIQASYGLWNALLTINGIILAAMTLVTSTSLIANIVILLSLISIFLLIHNYVVIKLTYLRIGEVLSESPDKLTQEQKEKDIKKSLSRNKRVQSFENFCLGILCLQALSIVSIFFCVNA